MVAEIKHASHFDALGLPLDELFAAELDAAGWGRGDERLIIEAFEPTVLERLGARGIRGQARVPRRGDRVARRPALAAGRAAPELRRTS